MTDEIEVTVKLRWEGRWLTAGMLRLGDVLKPMPMNRRSALALGIHELQDTKWIGLRGDIATGYYDTEAEAKRAVEQAAIKALKGTEHE